MISNELFVPYGNYARIILDAPSGRNISDPLLRLHKIRIGIR